ncbi:CCA tRNA nucleotidyltransferase [Candidatus Tisiphia endosymbiont of Nemotelus uliginosus]|uniref:CCA tRNA nucleotidyltransferase n=1 Tax=Candidatus Tisiphia endosymbiont of Nemotelus uliginosus TaxID=3077926 RepID=UPI0035C8CC65
MKQGGGAARVVGGAVRDAILNHQNYDIDIVTNLLPQQTIKILSKSNIQALPTGAKYGTVTAFLNKEKFEITTLRKDVQTDGRYASVMFTDDFFQDAARRDFTINALSYCPFEHKVYDYFNGLQDLQESKVRFIGQAYKRIQEDCLRILRFFRFSCYYAKQLDSNGLNACVELKENLRFLSKERIKWEMDKLLIAVNSPNILQQMFNVMILQLIFPITKFDQTILLRAITLSKQIGGLKLYHIYSLLFYHIPNLQLRDLLDLKFSRQEASKIISMIKLINTELLAVNTHILRKIWLENSDYLQCINILVALDKLELRVAQKFITDYSLLKPRPIFPLNGHDLHIRNIHGKVIGNLIDRLKKLWIDSDFMLTREQLLNMLENEHENYY